jgi:hypothetical protein
MLPFIEYSICSVSWVGSAFLCQRKFSLLGCWHKGQSVMPDDCPLTELNNVSFCCRLMEDEHKVN